MNRDYSRRSGKEFSRIASEYDKGRRGEDLELWGNETRRLANLEEEDLVLDLGCGTGLYTVAIGRESDALMCGMDPAVSMLGQAREKSRDVHWFNGIGEWLPVREGLLDCIFSSQVWHHIQDKQGTADECGRVLKVDGTVVIRTIGHRQLHDKVIFKYFPEIKQNQLDVYPSDEEFTAYFKNAGFSDVEFHEYTEERYQTVEEFIEIATKKLWSMFRPITEEGLRRGVEDLRRYYDESGGAPVRNDEMITLVVPRK
jgi:ubiquinone/menaquinone biosynthesis C-methylase UbiE